MSPATGYAPSRFSRASGIAYGLLAVLLAVGSSPASPTATLARVEAPDSLTSSEFWQFFTTMSEPGGHFLSENFVSNEVSFQEVIPTLQASLTRDGVYLGVGPEQNFTYIANLAPKLAVIFDIRRQNAMQHLLYKALFELSPTRTEFVSRLFSQPTVARLPANIAVKALFDSAKAALKSDSAYKANLADVLQLLTVTRGFALPKDDIASIEYLYNVFFVAGPEINYGYRSGTPGFARSPYPDFGMLQAATNADSVQMAFLATETNYGAIRRLQLRNLIVPVVGDFGGPSAIRSVGKWLSERQLTVTAFYVSNVEQYLFRDIGASDRFYSNVTSLPLDTTSRFIRSVPRMGGSMPMMTFSRRAGGPGYLGFNITRDAAGNTTTQTFRDSAGVTLMQTRVDTVRQDSTGTFRMRITLDSTGMARSVDTTVLSNRGFSIQRDSTTRRMLAIRDSLQRLNSTWQVAGGPTTQVMMGGLLTSGLAPIRATLDRFFLGELKTYTAVVEMTKVTGWR